MRLLLVEDDEPLAKEIQNAVMHDGYTVDWLKDHLSTLHALSCEAFDAVILDLGFQNLQGFKILKTLRNEGNQVPVLLLFSSGPVVDHIRGLDAGADDYLIKPFEFIELKARLRALLRRSRGSANPVMSYGDIKLDPLSRRITYKGDPIKLTRREYILLKELLQHTGKVLSKERLEQTLYGWQDDIDSNALEVHIHHLRRKFYTLLIRTRRGLGYIIEKTG